jgi:hypothetical protein
VRWLEESFLRGSDLMTYDEPALDGPTTPAVCSSQNIGEGIPADIEYFLRNDDGTYSLIR